jgi:hypothetical protein
VWLKQRRFYAALKCLQELELNLLPKVPKYVCLCGSGGDGGGGGGGGGVCVCVCVSQAAPLLRRSQVELILLPKVPKYECLCAMMMMMIMMMMMMVVVVVGSILPNALVCSHFTVSVCVRVCASVCQVHVCEEDEGENSAVAR